MDSVFQLILADEPDNPINLPVDLAIIIGRGENCDVRISDPSTSRVHCRVIAQAGCVRLFDAGSRWGTFVNNARVSECVLKHGDRVRVGETVLVFHVQSNSHHTTLKPRPEHVSQAFGSSVAMANDSGQPPLTTDNIPSVSSRSSDAINPLRWPGRLIASELVGTTFHRYHVRKLIAETRSGIVFGAESPDVGTPVVLKVFRSSLNTSQTEEQRFTRAIRLMFGQRHPNIVELLNGGYWGGLYFTVCEFIHGISASELIRKIGVLGMVPCERVLSIAKDLCQALRFAEKLGVVHRNIKPSNVLLRRDNASAMLNDLILSRCVETSGEQLTQAGDVVGDVNYMSPEQLGSGFPLDHRSDIFQLGAMLYELLSGQPPFSSGTVASTIDRVLSTDPISLRSRNLSVPTSVESIILKMLEKNPMNRYQSAVELDIDLKRISQVAGQNRVICREADPMATGWGGALEGMFANRS